MDILCESVFWYVSLSLSACVCACVLMCAFAVLQ